MSRIGKGLSDLMIFLNHRRKIYLSFLQYFKKKRKNIPIYHPTRQVFLIFNFLGRTKTIAQKVNMYLTNLYFITRKRIRIAASIQILFFKLKVISNFIVTIMIICKIQICLIGKYSRISKLLIMIFTPISTRIFPTI